MCSVCCVVKLKCEVDERKNGRHEDMKTTQRRNNHRKGLTTRRKASGAPKKTVGTLRSDDGDGNGNTTKAIGLISKTTILHVHHAFL